MTESKDKSSVGTTEPRTEAKGSLETTSSGRRHPGRQSLRQGGVANDKGPPTRRAPWVTPAVYPPLVYLISASSPVEPSSVSVLPDCHVVLPCFDLSVLFTSPGPRHSVLRPTLLETSTKRGSPKSKRKSVWFKDERLCCCHYNRRL